MIPIQIHAEYIVAGTKIKISEAPDPLSGTYGLSGAYSLSSACELEHYHGFHLPEMGGLPAQNATNRQAGHCIVEDMENGNIPELFVENGIATRDIFAVALNSDQSDLCHGFRHRGSWAVEFMNESDMADLEENLTAIYTALRPIIPEAELQKLREQKNWGYPIEALTMWKTITSRDWESGITDVDGFVFEGLGVTRLATEPQKVVSLIEALLPAAEEGLRNCESDAKEKVEGAEETKTTYTEAINSANAFVKLHRKTSTIPSPFF